MKATDPTGKKLRLPQDDSNRDIHPAGLIPWQTLPTRRSAGRLSASGVNRLACVPERNTSKALADTEIEGSSPRQAGFHRRTGG